MYVINNEAKSEREIRAMFPNTSLPKVWTKEILDGIGAVPILETPKPTVGELEVAALDGWEVDIKGNTVQKWVARAMFSEYTNEEGIVVAKLSQETEYLAKKEAEALNQAKEEMMKAVESLIQGEITKYNEANMVAFKDIDACAKYTTIPTYTHYQFCVNVITWQTNVWETARSIQTAVLAGTRTMPTLEAFMAELPVFGV